MTDKTVTDKTVCLLGPCIRLHLECLPCRYRCSQRKTIILWNQKLRKPFLPNTLSYVSIYLRVFRLFHIRANILISDAVTIEVTTVSKATFILYAHSRRRVHRSIRKLPDEESTMSKMIGTWRPMTNTVEI